MFAISSGVRQGEADVVRSPAGLAATGVCSLRGRLTQDAACSPTGLLSSAYAPLVSTPQATDLRHRRAPHDGHRAGPGYTLNGF
jgi:hypothetical protein